MIKLGLIICDKFYNFTKITKIKLLGRKKSLNLAKFTFTK